MNRAKINAEVIMKTAIQIIDVDGFHRLTLSQLARKLGIRSPSLYNHFDGLKELKTMLCARGLTLLNDCFTKVTVGQSKDDAVRALAVAYVEFARLHPGLYEAIERIPDYHDQAVHKAAEKVIDTMVRVFKAYDIQNDERRIHIARCFRSLFHGYVSIERQGGFELDFPRSSNLNIIVNTLLDGIDSYVSSDS